jgi:glycine C-acetyltransferase
LDRQNHEPHAFPNPISAQLAAIRAAGTYKRERVITTPQGATCDRRRAGAQPVRQQLPRPRPAPECARPRTRRSTAGATASPACASSAARRASTRSWSGASADFLGTEDTILYGSCFDANGGLFETLLGPEDAVISDELNHASIIDGVRLCKAQRFRYKNRDMADLEAQLIEADAKPARASS